MMLLLSVIVLQILFHSGQGLVRCNETVTKFQICHLAENYEQGWPIFKHGRPMMIANSITLFSLAEVNEDHSSISLNVLLTMYWNDARLTLKSK